MPLSKIRQKFVDNFESDAIQSDK